MKKLFLFSSATALFIGGVLAVESFNSSPDGELFKANVETLASSESHRGHCTDDTESDCVGVCRDCGQLCIAYGHKGSGYGIHE